MKRQRDRPNRRGTAVVETAIVLPLLLLLILGGIDFGFQLYIVHTMTGAAREGARRIAVRGGTQAQATSAALGELSGIHATFTVTFPPPTVDPNDTVVHISVPRDEISLGIYGLLGLSSGGTIQVQAVMRKEG
jgi:Flp pilus assembly protein TadG